MNLYTLLSEDKIIIDLEATEKWRAIEEIVMHLVNKDCLSIDSYQKAIDALNEREISLTTGIGDGIAIPHAVCHSITNVLACFARSNHGINFDSLDNYPVYFIVLFLVPKDQFHAHLRILAAIAKFLNDPNICSALKTATSETDILNIFSGKRDTL